MTDVSPRPRVTLVAHDIHDGGGMERACAELIRHTHDRVRYTIVATTLDNDLRGLVERWVRIRAPGRPFPLKFAYFYVAAGLAVRKRREDLVHTVGAIIPNRIDVATIQFCHAAFRVAKGHLAPSGASRCRRWNTGLAQALALAAERWSYRPGRVRAVAAVSSGVADEMMGSYRGLPVRITPNGVDPIRFRPDEAERDRVRREEGLEPGACVALFVGGDWERKGLGLAVEGLALARAEGADLVLWVVGEGDCAQVRSLARRMGAEGAVSFFGPRRDTERFYRSADVFVLPSAYEAFPLVCLEAAACGLPLVIPKISGAEELVGDNQAGIVVGRNPRAVGTALRILATDGPRRSVLGQEARRRASGYSWEASTAVVADLYGDLRAAAPMIPSPVRVAVSRPPQERPPGRGDGTGIR